MNLKNRLNEDMKAAMRAKDGVRLSTIRLVNAAIKQFEVDERMAADDAKIVAMVGKMIKQRKDSAAIYAGAGRMDLTDKENTEIAILQEYLPEMLSEEAIMAAVRAAIDETGASSMADMGKVMGVLKTRLAGKADMAQVNQVVKTVLSAV